MKEQKQKEQEQKLNEEIELWCEPQLDPSTGRVICKMPPKVVMDLLNNPSIDNAQKYLEWNKKKMEKIETAQKIIDSIYQDEQKISLKDIEKVEFYFSTTCPHCIKQAQVIKKLSKFLPDKIEGYMVSGDSVSLFKFLQQTGLKIKIYAFNYAQNKGITAVPVTVIYLKNNSKREFVGYNEKLNISELEK